eukprot:215954_1
MNLVRTIQNKKQLQFHVIFFCKQISKYYVRFHSQMLTLGGNEEDTRVTAIFEWKQFIKAFQGKHNKKRKNDKQKEKEKQIDWIISIRKEAKHYDEKIHL